MLSSPTGDVPAPHILKQWSALLEGQALGWPAWTFLLIAAGVLLVTALAIAGPRLTPRGAASILPPGLLARPAFTAGIAVQLLFFLGLQGLFVVLALWLQAGFGYSPIKAGATAATNVLYRHGLGGRDRAQNACLGGTTR